MISFQLTFVHRKAHDTRPKQIHTHTTTTIKLADIVKREENMQFFFFFNFNQNAGT